MGAFEVCDDENVEKWMLGGRGRSLRSLTHSLRWYHFVTQSLHRRCVASLPLWGGPGTHESVASAAHAASSAASAAAMQRRPRPMIGVGGGAAGPGGGGGRGATTSARSKAAEAFVGRNTRVGRRRRLAGRRLFLRRGVPLHLRGGGNKASHWQQLTSSLWRNWHLAQ